MNGTTEFIWQDVRDDAITAFGQEPKPADEAVIVEAFQRQPRTVIALVEEISGLFERGEARHPWGLLRTRVTARLTPVQDVAVDGAAERARRVAVAERWMRSTGIHIDRPSEIQSELFDHGGLLHDYADDPDLIHSMIELWRDQRPRGEQIDREAQTRADRWKASRVALTIPRLRAEPDPATAPNPFL